MAEPAFSVLVADLDRDDVDRAWPLSVEWLGATLAGTEAVPHGEDGRLKAHLHKQGREIVVTGAVRAKVVMPCARTLDPVDVDLEADIYLLLRPKEGPVAKGPRARREKERAEKEREETELGDEEAAVDTYSGEQVVLDDFVREHLLLELPLFPLRSDLRSAEPSSKGPPSQPPEEGPKDPDPRLQPLAVIAEKLKASRKTRDED